MTPCDGGARSGNQREGQERVEKSGSHQLFGPDEPDITLRHPRFSQAEKVNRTVHFPPRLPFPRSSDSPPCRVNPGRPPAAGPITTCLAPTRLQRFLVCADHTIQCFQRNNLIARYSHILARSKCMKLNFNLLLLATDRADPERSSWWSRRMRSNGGGIHTVVLEQQHAE